MPAAVGRHQGPYPHPRPCSRIAELGPNPWELNLQYSKGWTLQHLDTCGKAGVRMEKVLPAPWQCLMGSELL